MRSINMSKKMNYSEVAKVIDNFTQASKVKYDTMAYSAGYLGSLLTDIVSNMPRAKQLAIINQLNQSSVYTKDTV
jgi:hypothetical protein